MNPEKNVGSFYQLKPSFEYAGDEFLKFCFVVGDGIDNKAKWSERCLIDDEVLLMLVKSDMDLTMKTAEARKLLIPIAILDAAVAAACSAAAQGSKVDWKGDFQAARIQFKEVGRIPGSVFMIPDGRLIWISNIDFKYFEEVEL